MKCADCPYYWRELDDDVAQCHFVRLLPPELDPTPCEVNEHHEVDEYLES